MRHLATGYRTKWNGSQSSGVWQVQEERDLVKSGGESGEQE